LTSLIGKPVRFRCVLKDAEIFALRTGRSERVLDQIAGRVDFAEQSGIAPA